MKLEDKKKVTVRIYSVRQYGIVIGSHEGLIGMISPIRCLFSFTQNDTYPQ